MHNVLVTGGAGFAGSSFIRFLFSGTQAVSGFAGRIINLDKLTYAGNLQNLARIDAIHGPGGDRRYVFIKGDICDMELVENIFKTYQIDTVVHFAAESSVDGSIRSAAEFVRTNITGTFMLLEAARKHWLAASDQFLFHHISTDEIYGALGQAGKFSESSPYNPRNPYSASKASSNHLVMSYFHTYGLPVSISVSSNLYGPCQHREKLIPRMLAAMLEEKSLPVYGDGNNVRDWLYAEDHSEAVWKIITRGREGGCYNVGGENEWKNIDLIHLLCEKAAEFVGKEKDYYKKFITFVEDRPGHDRRYALDCTRIKQELGWKQRHTFGEGLEKTVRWYLRLPA